MVVLVAVLPDVISQHLVEGDSLAADFVEKEILYNFFIMKKVISFYFKNAIENRK